MSITPTYSGEVQLAGWRESHTSGATITLWLADPADLDVFRALTARKGNVAGQRFMAVLVEIGDDERPVQPPAAAPAPLESEKPKGGPLSRLAGQWCLDPMFCEWLSIRYIDRYDPSGGSPSTAAAEVIRDVCGISSRALLDHNPKAAALFNTRFRQPFMDYLSHHQPA